ncbi:MAG TPA: DMT family transporter [Burkholderiales bacterium]|nr:DMT family transporter [Burkholderiales bacterium]
MTPHSLLRGLAWAGLCVLVWAPLFSVAKRTLPLLDAFALGTVRYAFGILLLVGLLVLVEGTRALRFEGRFGAAAMFGLVGITGFNLFVWIGLAFTRPEHASIILALQTPLTALAVWGLRGQRPAAFTLACVVIAIAGVFVVITKGHPAEAFLALVDAASGRELLGDLLVFAGALAWVTYTLSASQFAGWSPLRLTVLTCIPGATGLVIANAIAVAGGWAVVPSLAAIAGAGWQVLYFSVGTVVLGVLAFNNAARHLGPLNTMLALNLIPVCVFAIEAGLGRSFGAVELGGAALVVGALVANNLYLRGTSTRR